MTTQSDSEADLNDIDRRLLQLLKERAQVARGEVTDHEQWLFAGGASQLAERHAEDFDVEPELLAGWLRHAASLCRPAVTAIAYLGPIYSYSYLAAAKHFGMAANLVPVSNIAAAFDEVRRGQAQYSVVPIENSTDGRVVDTLGMFATSPAKICGEVLLPIHHCLLGQGDRAAIREVHSKPQAISQCRQWLAQRLPQASVVEVSSTAVAAAHAADQDDVAAIASLEAGLHHGLRVIDHNIEDHSENVTRFAIIGNRQQAPTGRDKTSLMFQLEHQPGALARAMLTFQSAQVNLTWIESFPLPNRPNEYLFFVELEGHQQDAPVSSAVTELAKHTSRLDVLGSYCKGALSSA